MTNPKLKAAIAKGQAENRSEARRRWEAHMAVVAHAERLAKAAVRKHVHALSEDALFAMIQTAERKGQRELYLTGSANDWGHALFPTLYEKDRFVDMAAAAAAIDQVEGVHARHVLTEGGWVGSMDLSWDPGYNHITVTWDRT